MTTSRWRTLAPILISAAVLLAGNGMLVTMIALRGPAEGFDGTWIGIFGAAYYLGFLLASWLSIHLIRQAGHIRVFAGLAAAAAATTLGMLLWIEAEVWTAARFVQGLAFSGISTVIESWLNGLIENRNRGRILSMYRVVDLGAVTGGQFLLPVVGIEDFHIFVVCAIFFCVALMPVTLSNHSSPSVPDSVRFDLKAVWRMSPVACAGCVAVGMANGAFRTLSPTYATAAGLDVAEVATFLSLFIAAGAVSQFPIGWLSDRFDRRTIIMGVTVGASAASLFIVIAAGMSPMTIFIGSALFGGFALPLYSLSSAHANDHCPPGRFVTLAAGLLLCFAAGAFIGSPVAAVMMDQFGPPALFWFICGVHALFLGFVIYRRSRRPSVPRERQSAFVSLLRTSPAMFALTQHGEGKHQDDID
ncbi:MAG: MFS transporter [Minwuia sp.]|uniref:MFS transporter n=1 Tax=Minwuia sp. TaxID=2493630 RepID=UPI003A83E8C1